MGPAVFFGLTIYMLATGSPVEKIANPSEAMDLVMEIMSGGPAEQDDLMPIGFAPVAFLGPDPVWAGDELAVLAADPAPVATTRVLPVIADTRIAGWLGQIWASGPARPIPESDAVEGWIEDPQITALSPLIETGVDTTPSTLPAPASRPIARATYVDTTASLQSPVAEPLPSRFPVFALGVPRRLLMPLVPGTAPETPLGKPEQPANRFEINGFSVRLRETPSLQGQILARFDPGTEAIRTDTQGDWVKVTLPDQSEPNQGWIFGQYLTPVFGDVPLEE